MNDCFITEYKAEINNPNLEKYGVFTFNVKAVAAGSYNENAAIVVIRPTVNCTIKVVDGSGYFGNTFAGIESDHLTEKTLTANANNTIYFANTDCVVEVDNKYNIQTLQFGGNYAVKAIATVDAKSLVSLSALTTVTLFGSATGDVSVLKDAFGDITYPNFVNSAELTGDVSELAFGRFGSLGTAVYGDFTKLLENATNSSDASNMIQVVCPSDKIVSIDLSKTPALVTNVFAPGAKATKNIQARWTSSRPTDRNIISIQATQVGGIYHKFDFGVYLDAMLVNQAACQVPSSGVKVIVVNGTKTSASDAAVATLKAAGYTLNINDEEL